MSLSDPAGNHSPSFRRRAAVFLLAPCLVLIIAAGLWPFNFQTRCNDCRNAVEIDASSGGYHFAGEGMIIDEDAGQLLYDRLQGAAGITIAVHVLSDTLFQEGPARIISLSGNPSERNFTLGQQRDAMEFRLRTPSTGKNGSDPSTSADGVISTRDGRLVVATYDGATFRIFSDGALAGERPLAAGDFSGWSPEFKLYYGNESTGDRAWRGHLYDAAVYDTAMGPARVSKLTPESLALASPDRILHLQTRCPISIAERSGEVTRIGSCRIPDTFQSEHEWAVLHTKVRPLSDVLSNALMWAPLAFFLVLCESPWLTRWRLPIAGVLAAFVFTIEIAQAPLFSRTSSLMDAASAILGLIAGALLGHRLLSRAA